MSVFNVDIQNKNIDHKIVAGLERISQVFRALLWSHAKSYGLSPIQIQLLIFIKYHSSDKTTISYLAREFNLTKPTISDAVKLLEQKKLIKKIVDDFDRRSFTLGLTALAEKIILKTEDYINPLSDIIAQFKKSDKEILWHNLANLISQLNKLDIISVQRTCYNCTHFAMNGKRNYCTLLSQYLEIKDIRIDCSDFVALN